MSDNATNATPSIRTTCSLGALAICWFISGIAFALYLRDERALLGFYLWSLPFFAVAWIFVGIPVIAMGNRILRTPKVLLGVAGAVAGFFIMLLPNVVMWVISPGDFHFAKWNWTTWSDGDIFFVFAAGIGAAATVLYSWLLSRAIRQTDATAKIDPLTGQGSKS